MNDLEVLAVELSTISFLSYDDALCCLSSVKIHGGDCREAINRYRVGGTNSLNVYITYLRMECE